jgi:hypothetical protein
LRRTRSEATRDHDTLAFRAEEKRHDVGLLSLILEAFTETYPALVKRAAAVDDPAFAQPPAA